MIDFLTRDLRQAFRALRRDAGFTTTIVLTLAIGIGVNAAVFSVVYALLLKPLPYPDADRLVMVWTSAPGEGVAQTPSAYGNIRDWREQNSVFEELAVFDPSTRTLTVGDYPEQVTAAEASADLFSVLRVSPAIGRAFTADEVEERSPAMVLSDHLWRRLFAGSPDAIGRTLEVAGRSLQVVGVMPPGFGFPTAETAFWVPLTLFNDVGDGGRGTGPWRTVGRLRPEVTLERAQAEMEVIARRLEAQFPGGNSGLTAAVVPLQDELTGRGFRLALWTLFGAVGLVFLIACANAAHLVLARGLGRTREFALREALGATTSRLIRQTATENTLIALIAGVTGVALCWIGLRALVGIAPANVPRMDAVGIDGPVIVYAVTLALLVGLVVGAVPILSYSRSGLFELLREGRTSMPPGVTQHTRQLLIVFQFALAIVLVFGANLLVRSLLEARGQELGFDPENVLLANLSMEAEERRTGFYARVVEDVGSIPGVEAAALIEDLFIGSAPTRRVVVEGAATEPRSEPLRVDAIDGNFLGTVGTPLIEGRAFNVNDRADALPVAIINRSMASRYWPGESAVGRRFRTDGQVSWVEVVGVVGDMRRQGFEAEPIAQVFRPYAQAPSRNMNLLVRAEGPVFGLTDKIRSRIAAIDGTVPLYGVSTVTQALDRFLLQRRFQTVLLGAFSTIALVLAAIGIYGLVQYSVSQRTRELGVRAALGAPTQTLIVMILKQGLSLALPGVLLGLAGALLLARWLSALLYGVGAYDLLNIALTSAVLVLTALVASYIPAHRAASVDPVVALRA